MFPRDVETLHDKEQGNFKEFHHSIPANVLSDEAKGFTVTLFISLFPLHLQES